MGNVIKGAIATDKSGQHLNADEGMGDNVLVVIQDYPSADVSRPLYRTGEKLGAISQEASKWRVRSATTGSENYIPSSHVAKLYHGWLFEGVARQKAEELLLLPGNSVGSFMVRDSVREKGVYSLSVKHRVIKHYRISRMDNSWYYISPRLTFQCLEDMVNHYSDCADGLCCVLTSPCLSGACPSSDVAAPDPPVVLRRNFDWRDVDRKGLVSLGRHDNRDSMVSYGVRNSLSAYFSLAETQDSLQLKRGSRRRKGRSVYAIPVSQLDGLDYQEDL